MGASGIETFYRDEITHMVAGPRLMVCAWYDAPDMTQIRQLRRINEVVRNCVGDDDVVYCNVVVSGTPFFPGDVREEITAISRDFGHRGLAQAHLILLEGFAGTAVRAFLSTVNLMSRAQVPMKVFAAREPTEAWLLEKLRAVHPSTGPESLTPAFDAVIR